MNKTALYIAMLFVVLLLVQAVIFNNLVLFNCAMPFIFIYVLITMPVTTPPNLAMTVGFALGLCVDAFADTYGLNALCCVILAFVRRPLFHLYVPHDDDLAGQCLNMRTMAVSAFLKYALTMTLVYCVCANVIESFSLFNPLRMLLRIVASTVYTTVLIYAVDSLSLNRK